MLHLGPLGATKRRMGVRSEQDQRSVRRIASARMGGWFATRFNDGTLDRAHFMGGGLVLGLT